jgi:hypothetical protein
MERKKAPAASADADQEPDAFEAAIQPLRDLCAKSCRTWAERASFLALVIEAMSR